MGLLLSILFSYIGVIEMLFVVRDIVHQVGLHHDQMKVNRQSSLKSTSSLGSSTHALNNLQQDIRKSIKLTHEQLCESDTVQLMVDGVRYKEGYRIPNAGEDDISKRWFETRVKLAIDSGNDGHVNRVKNADAHIVVANKMAGDSNRRSEDDSLRSSRLSVGTVIDKNEAAKLYNNSNHIELGSQNAIENNGKIFAELLNETSDEMPQKNHFDECSEDHLYELDGDKRKPMHKVDEIRRPKGLKFKSSRNGADDEIQLLRSEDIDSETDPWAELKPEQFHDVAFWRRERAMSIAENDEMQTISNENSYREQFKRTADNLTNDNKNIEEPYDEGKDVSNEANKTIKLSDGSDIDEIVGDGKINEFMDYIERIDNNEYGSDKLQFKEFMGSSKRQRHPSYNYEANKEDDDLLKDYLAVVNGDDSVKIMQNDIEIRNTERTKNNRKPNMFALPTLIKTTIIDNYEGQYERYTFEPVIRVTSTEDERIEHFLHENAICSTAEIPIKSKTTQIFDCDESANEMFKFDKLSNAVVDNNRGTFEIDERWQSFLSEIISDSNKIDFKDPADEKCFDRMDSSESNKSNTFSERSQSRLSDLEYIRGRDDWKNHYGHYEIGEEIDSDSYHHLRRHSEAENTLEYIRDRNEWVKNQNLKLYGRRTSFPKIFEAGERRIVIQDEIDSDEYHHNLFWNEKFRSASESKSPAKLFESNVITKLKPDNAIQNRDFVEISNTEINDVIENIIKGDTIHSDDIEITVLDLATDVCPSTDDQRNIFEPFIIISEAIDARELSLDVNHNRGTRDSHFPRNRNERTTSTIDSNRLNVNTTIKLLDEKQNEVISLAENEIDNIEITQIETEFEMKNKFFDENGDENDKRSIIAKKFLQNKIKKKSEIEMNYITVVQKPTNTPLNTFDSVDESRIKKESNMNIQTGIPLQMKNEQTSDIPKTNQKLKVENIEDLIRDVSLGPWFHK